MIGEDRLLLLTLGICGFASSLAARSTDPMVTAIAADMIAPVATVALLSTSYALPYGLGQPFLGPLGDSLGKARVLKACLIIFTIALSVASVAPSLPTLFAARAVAGLAAGGIIPLGLAMIGDRFPFESRQVAIGRFLSASVMGQLLGVTSAGILADTVGWRTAMWATAAVAMVAMLLSIARLADGPVLQTKALDYVAARDRYALVFRNPRSFICFGGVFFEGIAVFGVMPFVGEIVERTMDGGPAEAGFIIAGLAIGGIIFSFTVQHILRAFGPFGMMRIGGVLAGTGLLLFSIAQSWIEASVCFLALGIGFFMVHNSLQNRATELAPTARGSAVSLHAFFFFLGQGIAPILFGIGLHRYGETWTIAVCAGLITLTGLACAHLLLREDDRSDRRAAGLPAAR
jgi:predicted MFS family arabinose efflux permease